MAERLDTPVIYLETEQLETPSIYLEMEQLKAPVIYLEKQMLDAPYIVLTDDADTMNFLDTCSTTSPVGKTEECAKITVNDVTDALGLAEVMDIEQEYTLSFWMKADVSGYVRTTGGGTFKASSIWTRCVHTFTAEGEDLVFSFDTKGIYYIYHTQLEIGNKATDYRPAVEDMAKAEDLVNYSTKSEVKQTADNILLTVKTTYQTIEGMGQYSTTKEMNSAIDQKAGSIISTVNEKLKSYSTTEEMNTSIKQSADGVITEVSKTYATKETVENIEIGGRNLLLNTGASAEEAVAVNGSDCVTSGISKWTNSGGILTLDGDASESEFYYRFMIPAADNLYTLEAGKEYTFSGKAKITTESGTLSSLRVRSQHYQSAWTGGLNEIISTEDTEGTGGTTLSTPYIFLTENPNAGTNVSAGGWIDFSFTHKIPEDATGVYFSVQVYYDGSWVGSVKLAELKLEEGNKKTDWTPAPEDVEGKVSIVSQRQTELIVDLEGVETRVLAVENLQTELAGDLSGLTTRVYQTEQKLTQDGIVSIVGAYYAKSTELSAVEARVLQAETTIAQHSNEIALTVKEADVTGNYLIGKINLTSTTALIEAAHIDLVGAVTISAFSSELASDYSTVSSNAASAKAGLEDLYVEGTTLIDGANIYTGTIKAEQIAAGTITATEIKADTITATQIKSETITKDEIASGAIVTDKIDDEAITKEKIAANTITAEEIAAGTITGDEIKVGSLTVEHLNVELITAENLSGEVADLGYATIGELSAVSGEVGELSAIAITTNNLSAEVAELGYATVGELDAAEARIGTLETTSITTDNLSAEVAELGYATIAQLEAVDAKIENLEVGNITSGSIAAGAITTEKLAAEAVTAEKIKAGTITAEEIAAGTITGEEIKAGSLTVEHLNVEVITVENLSAEVAELGYATIVQLNAVDAEIDSLSAIAITTTNLSAEVAELGYATVAELDAAKGRITTLETETISADRIDVEGLFSQNITATNLHVTGESTFEGIINDAITLKDTESDTTGKIALEKKTISINVFSIVDGEFIQSKAAAMTVFFTLETQYGLYTDNLIYGAEFIGEKMYLNGQMSSMSIVTKSAEILDLSVLGEMELNGIPIEGNKVYSSDVVADVRLVKGSSGDYYYFRPYEVGMVMCGSQNYPWYKVFTERLEVTEASITCLPTYNDTVSYATNMYVGTGGIYHRTTTTSSRTIKHDIRVLEDEQIKAEHLYDVNVYQFKYNEDIITDKDDARYMRDLPGFIIEELYEKYPIAVDTPSDNVKEWSWNAQYLIPPMLKLLQDQHKTDMELISDVESLQAQLEQARFMIEQLYVKLSEQQKIIETMAQ